MKIEMNKKADGDFLGRKYNVTVWKSVSDYGTIPGKHTINSSNTKIMRNLEMMNINGLGQGQVHFVDENGAYVLYPWCAIIALEPVIVPIHAVVGSIFECIFNEVTVEQMTIKGFEGCKFKVIKIVDQSYTLESIGRHGENTFVLSKENLTKFFKKI